MGGVAAKSVVAGRYELEILLGRGGMGEVWRARHLALNTHWAIKFLHSASAQRESARKRFETEAQVTAQLKTRHAVQVFDFGVTDDGQPYLVMELLEGETIGHRLEREGRLGLGATVSFLSQAARALERAHALGIVHRDLKPDNLVVVSDEEGREYIKVLDFGIAKLLGELEAEPEPEDAASLRLSHHSFTRTGNILGTPYYMAPEQIRDARHIDMRADIWGFGVVAFEVLTGVPPFEGKDIYELFQNIQDGKHVKARELRPKLPAAFDMWFDIACAIDPAKRFPSAKAAATHLSVALNEPSMPEGSFGGDLAEFAGHPGEDDVRGVATLDEETLRGGKVLGRRRRSVRELASAAPARTQVKLSGSGVNPTARTIAHSGPPPPLTPPPPTPLPTAPSEAPVPPAVPSPPPARPTDRRGLYGAMAALAFALLGLVGWTSLRGSRAETQAPFVAGAAVAGSPTPAPAVSSVDSASTAAAPGASLDTPPAGTPTPRAPAAATGTTAVLAALTTHPSAVRAAAPARMASHIASSPPAPSTAPATAPGASVTTAPRARPATSSQSPFELPPLGL